MKDAKCGACRFWRMGYEDDFNSKWGECRRHAPRPVEIFLKHAANLLGSMAWLAEYRAGVAHNCPEYRFEGKSDFQIYEWPFTRDSDWCGEFAS